MQLDHYFLAVPLPEKMKEELSLFIQRGKETLAFDRWVHHKDLHITLAFLGACTKEKVESVITACDSKINTQPFTLSLGGFGTFGRAGEPRIFWLGVSESAELVKHRQKVFTAMEGLGFSLDQRPFSPHITLARKWKGKEHRFEQNMIPGLDLAERKWEVNHYVLYKTNLNTQPRYQVIAQFQLGGI